jgi:hypothetical protein
VRGALSRSSCRRERAGSSRGSSSSPTGFLGRTKEEVEFDNASGLSRPRDAFAAVRVGETLEGEALPALVHAAFHLYAHEQAPGLPYWLEEGLAQYFGGVETVEGELAFGRRTGERYKSMKELLDLTRPIPLGDFVDLDEKAFKTGESVLPSCAQAWFLAFFLVDKHPRILRRLWPVPEEHAPGGPPDTFEDAEWLQYLAEH